jgi:hypothetical protein
MLNLTITEPKGVEELNTWSLERYFESSTELSPIVK